MLETLFYYYYWISVLIRQISMVPVTVISYDVYIHTCHQLCEFCHQLCDIVTNCVTLSPTVWHCLQLCDIVTNCVTLSPTVWHCHQLCDIVTNCVTLSPTVWHCHQLCDIVTNCVTLSPLSPDEPVLVFRRNVFCSRVRDQRVSWLHMNNKCALSHRQPFNVPETKCLCADT